MIYWQLKNQNNVNKQCKNTYVYRYIRSKQDHEVFCHRKTVKSLVIEL